MRLAHIREGVGTGAGGSDVGSPGVDVSAYLLQEGDV